MGISTQIESSIANSSMIRKMFEEGDRRRQLYGEDKVFDLSIGNPIFEPPAEVQSNLLKLIQSDERGTHRYMPNSGFPKTRQYIAGMLNDETGLSFGENDIIMTAGAGGALNVIFKALLNPGDEVIVFKPYFLEYNAYVNNYGGEICAVKTREDFQLDFAALEEKLSVKTKAVLINSPNNPTGVIYSEEELAQLGQLLKHKSAEFGQAISLISDEPYRRIVYETTAPSIFPHYENAIVATSYSKDLAMPGERIGYIAISPKHQDHDLLSVGAVLSLRILGFVNAPALMQRLLPLVGNACVDLASYRSNRDLLYNHLIKIGFSCIKPAGAFYLFPKSPIEDDLAFIEAAQQLNLLMVPGSGFGMPGYFRISFCFETEFIERSLPVFTDLARQYHLID
ncbi:MAG: pyridoxal phosphate-dependent aminotransferase [Deltaproteobacteria bacterium]|nr:pyridoxal phosphate-dependent aminotransferase [Deltaproteobacteria bacterium]